MLKNRAESLIFTVFVISRCSLFCGLGQVLVLDGLALMLRKTLESGEE